MAIVPNKATARSYFEEVLNHGNMSTADAIFAPDIHFHYPLGELSGADALKEYIGVFRTAFPDIHFTVADLVAEGDRVAARWMLGGSQDRGVPRKATYRPESKRARHYDVPCCERQDS